MMFLVMVYKLNSITLKVLLNFLLREFIGYKENVVYLAH